MIKTSSVILSKLAVGIIVFYRFVISPLLPMACRFSPTCSEYGIEVFKRFGFLHGACLLSKRLLKCHPLGGSGFDPPPCAHKK
jgi:putative membrane protein insertion efficiency factor